LFADRSVAGLVAIVTDSTASLPNRPADEHDTSLLAVVPLRLLAGGLVADDGGEEAAAVEAAVASGERLTTARPTPERFAAAYRAAADAGASAVVSVHLPGTLSGTIASAELAATGSAVPVHVVDARTIGTGLGLIVLDAARQACAGLEADEIAARAGRYAERLGSFFALADQDALLAGGRLMPSGLLPGGGLVPGGGSVPSGRHLPGGGPHGARPAGERLTYRPILRIRHGQIVPVERVRTMAAAADRLAELAASFAGNVAVDLAVEHTGAASRAAELAERLTAVIPQVRRSYMVRSGTAIMAHVGGGMLGLTVAPHQADG